MTTTTLVMQKVKHLYLEEAKKTPNIAYKYMVSEKLDGWYVYANYTPDNGWSSVMSSRDRVIPSMEHVKRQYLDKLPNPKGACRLIMEAIIPNTEFSILNGIFNRSIGDYLAEDVHFKAHELIYFNDLNVTAIERYNTLTKFCNAIPKHSRIELLPVLAVTDSKEEWLNLFDKITYAGGEGIILKQEQGVYCPGKRNSSLLKIKLETTLDLLCVGVYDTVGEKGHRNLNLKLERANKVEINVRVGKHEDIALIDANNKSILGKVCEIKCMKELEHGKLREPRFVRIRNDKTEID